MLVSDIVLCSKSEPSVAKNVVKGVIKRKTTSSKSSNKSKLSSKTNKKLVGNEIDTEEKNSVDYKVKDYNATDASDVKLNHEDTAIPLRYFIEKSTNNKVIESKNKNHAESRKEIFPNQDKYEDARLKNNLILQSEENYLAYKIYQEKINMDQNMRTVNTKSVSLDSGTENTRNLSQDTGTGNSRNVSQDTGTGNLRNLSQDTGTGNSRNVSQDTATVISRNVSQDTAAVISRNVSQDTAAVISRNVSQDTAAVISRNVSQDSGTVDTRNVSQDTETGNLINMSQDTGIMDLRNIYQDTGTRNTKNMFQNTGPRNTINMSQDKETENTKSVSQGAETVKTNVIQDSEIVETRRVLQRKGGGNTINMSHTTRNMVQKTKCTIQSKTNMDKDVNKISITPETRETGQETENVNRKIKFLSKERIDAVGQMESATQDTELMNQAKGSTYQRTGSMIWSKSTKHVVWLAGILLCVACFKSALS